MSSSSGSYGVGNYPAQNGEGFNQATGNYELGGDLIRPTAINTSATNTLALTGLEAGDSINDSILVVDTSGVVKFVDSFEALLINAVKELADQKAQLAKRIDDLEERLAAA